MIVAIHQSHYLPWLGYVDKLDQADRFVLLDGVQFTRQGWQNRNRIRTATGSQWLSVPVKRRHPQPIDEVRICEDQAWRAKHWHAVRTNYGRARWFRAYAAVVGDLLARPWERLAELNRAHLFALTEAFGIRTPIEIQPPDAEPMDATARLVAVCRRLGADRYLCGTGGLGYLDLAQFEAAGIEVLVQDFRCAPYPQAFEGFVPGLAAVDLLFNCGPEALARLRAARRLPVPARQALAAAAGGREPAAVGAGL